MKYRLAVLLLGLACAARAEKAPPVCHYHQAAELPASFEGGHVTTEGVLNGAPISLLLDSGSNTTLLSRSEAKKRGLSMRATNMRSYGVGGETTTSVAQVPDITIGFAHGKDIEMLVVDDMAAPLSVGGIVGTDFLFRTDVELSPAEGKIKFFAAKDCDTAFLARWDGEISNVELGHGPGDDKRAFVTVEVNGAKIKALIDSGATMSIIDLRTAAKFGITPDSPGVIPGRTLSGIGSHMVADWVAPFASIAIGGETIKNVKVTIADLWGAAQRDRRDQRTFEMAEASPHMILGADFLRAHHLLFAFSQQQLYFSYLGGKVFQTE